MKTNGPTKEQYMKWAIEAIVTDGRKIKNVSRLSKETVIKGHFGCYVCNKRNESLIEVVMEGDEPFWFGSSCAAEFKKLTGVDLNKLVTK